MGKGVIGLVGLAVVAVALGVYKTATRLLNLEVSLTGVNIDTKKTFLEYTTLVLKLGIYNPNTSDVIFTSFTGDVYYKGNRVTSIDKTAPIVFKGRSTTGITIPVQMPNGKLLTSFLDVVDSLINKTSVASTVTVKGTLKADNFTVPINQTVDLKS